MVNLAVPVDFRVKIKEIEKRDKYLDLARELKMLWNMKVTVIPMIMVRSERFLKNFSKETRRAENRKTCRDHLNYRIIKISQNTEKSPGDLRRFAATQTRVKNYQLTLVWITRKKYNNE